MKALDEQVASVTVNRCLRPVLFDIHEADRATDEWGFNCGPGALCAALHLRPDDLRPQMGDFESKGYTNPKLMIEVLKRCGVEYKQVYRNDEPAAFPPFKHALVRIQWGGSWTRPGVPMRARYRRSHWIVARDDSREVFDVNAMCVGGWISFHEWSEQLVPWLCGDVVPGWDGTWWPTHALEVVAPTNHR